MASSSQSDDGDPWRPPATASSPCIPFVMLSRRLSDSHTWVLTSDGSSQLVEEKIVRHWPTIWKKKQQAEDHIKHYPISLPPCVNSDLLTLIIDYCRFHTTPGRSRKERKSFDEKFIRLDADKLFELGTAAESIGLMQLVDLVTSSLVQVIQGNSVEETQETDDLTEGCCSCNQKQEPLKHTHNDTRTRLLNTLHTRKWKEIKEIFRLKNAGVAEEPENDPSINDLLAFINGEDGDSKEMKTSKTDSKGMKTSPKNKKKKKKKTPKRKEQQNNVFPSCTMGSSSSASKIDICEKESNVLGTMHPNLGKLKPQDDKEDAFPSEDESYNDDSYDDIDPELKARIDREVEDFARILSSDWSERRKELLYSGQQRKILIPSSNFSSCSLRRIARPDGGDENKK